MAENKRDDSGWEVFAFFGQQWPWAVQQSIRDEAYRLWLAAGQPAGQAAEFWRHAEEVVLKPVRERIRHWTSLMFNEPRDRIQELAYILWESQGRQQDIALDYWVAAEQEWWRATEKTQSNAWDMTQTVAKIASRTPGSGSQGTSGFGGDQAP